MQKNHSHFMLTLRKDKLELESKLKNVRDRLPSIKLKRNLTEDEIENPVRLE